MRRGTIVVGMATVVVALSGAAAPASTLPLAIRFDQGTVAVGTFPTAPSATAAAPATFQGTIDAATFAASFPASSITLPDAVVERVDYGTPYGSGRFVVHAVPGAFTGSANGSGSIDLRGLIAYDLEATTAQGTFTCVSDTPVPLTLAGTAITPATGAYGVFGEQISLTIHPEHPQDPLEVAFCASQAQKVSPGAPVRSVFAGTLTIPGSIPVPAGTAAPSPARPTPTTTPSTATAKPGRLAVRIARPKAVRRGRRSVTTVVVRNTGAGDARSVTVEVTAAEGVAPRTTTRTYGAIAAGSSRTFAVRLRTTAGAARRSTLRVTAKGASGLSASTSTTLRLR